MSSMRRAEGAGQRFGAAGAFLEGQPDHRLAARLGQRLGHGPRGHRRQRHRAGQIGRVFQQRPARDAACGERFADGFAVRHVPSPPLFGCSACDRSSRSRAGRGGDIGVGPRSGYRGTRRDFDAFGGDVSPAAEVADPPHAGIARFPRSRCCRRRRAGRRPRRGRAVLRVRRGRPASSAGCAGRWPPLLRFPPAARGVRRSRASGCRPCRCPISPWSMPLPLIGPFLDQLKAQPGRQPGLRRRRRRVGSSPHSVEPGWMATSAAMLGRAAGQLRGADQVGQRDLVRGALLAAKLAVHVRRRERRDGARRAPSSMASTAMSAAEASISVSSARPIVPPSRDRDRDRQARLRCRKVQLRTTWMPTPSSLSKEVADTQHQRRRLSRPRPAWTALV